MSAMDTQTYTLDFFNNLILDGFDYCVSPDTLNIISKLASEVGAPTYVKTPVFQKKEPRQNASASINSQSSAGFKKRRDNKHMELISDEQWNTQFKSTVIERKTGIDSYIETIRSHLNTLTDKNYVDYKNTVIQVI